MTPLTIKKQNLFHLFRLIESANTSPKVAIHVVDGGNLLPLEAILLWFARPKRQLQERIST
jgi:hypothetical protein